MRFALPLLMVLLSVKLAICSPQLPKDLFVENQARSLGTFMGLLEIIEGSNSLIKNPVDDPVIGVQHLVGGVVRLIEIGTKDLEIEIEERFKIMASINEFMIQINALSQQIIKHGVSNLGLRRDDADREHDKMVEGLTLILHNVIYILIEPKAISVALSKILTGIYLVISSILANGNIDATDWGRLLNALTSILNLKYMRVLTTNQIT